MAGEDRDLRDAIDRFGEKIDVMTRAVGTLTHDVGVLKVRVLGNGDEAGSIVGRLKAHEISIVAQDTRVDAVEKQLPNYVTHENCSTRRDRESKKKTSTAQMIINVFLACMVILSFLFGSGVLSRGGLP